MKLVWIGRYINGRLRCRNASITRCELPIANATFKQVARHARRWEGQGGHGRVMGSARAHGPKKLRTTVLAYRHIRSARWAHYNGLSINPKQSVSLSLLSLSLSHSRSQRILYRKLRRCRGSADILMSSHVSVGAWS